MNDEIKSWILTLKKQESRIGRPLTLNEMIDLAREYDMTQEELKAQQESWVRAMRPTGDPRFD